MESPHGVIALSRSIESRKSHMESQHGFVALSRSIESHRGVIALSMEPHHGVTTWSRIVES